MVDGLSTSNAFRASWITDLGDSSPLYFSIIASLRDSFLGFGIAIIGFGAGIFWIAKLEMVMLPILALWFWSVGDLFLTVG